MRSATGFLWRIGTVAASEEGSDRLPHIPKPKPRAWGPAVRRLLASPTPSLTVQIPYANMVNIREYEVMGTKHEKAG